MEESDYYTRQSPTSDPGTRFRLFARLPHSVAELCAVVHGLVAHRDSVPQLYGFDPAGPRKLEADTRFVEKILGKIIELDDAPLLEERIPEKRFLGSCRDFAILLCGMLRHKGVPARLRCGFGAYWAPGVFTDHWACEYWNNGEQEWMLADAEIGAPERRRYGIAFDHTNVPRDQFLVAGKAWKMCREEGRDPDLFGVHHIGVQGLWFVRANLLRDLASLNKLELLPWDYTRFFDKYFDSLNDHSHDEIHPDEVRLLDRLAGLTSGDAVPFGDVIALYDGHADLQVGPLVKSYTIAGPKMITLGG